MIPPLTKPIENWQQPKLEAITINNGVAEMDQLTFIALRTNNQSVPSPMNEGQMWRRKGKGKMLGGWLLCWFFRDVNGKLTLDMMPIKISDGFEPTNIDKAIEANNEMYGFVIKDFY